MIPVLRVFPVVVRLCFVVLNLVVLPLCLCGVSYVAWFYFAYIVLWFVLLIAVYASSVFVVGNAMTFIDHTTMLSHRSPYYPVFLSSAALSLPSPILLLLYSLRVSPFSFLSAVVLKCLFFFFYYTATI